MKLSVVLVLLAFGISHGVQVIQSECANPDGEATVNDPPALDNSDNVTIVQATTFATQIFKATREAALMTKGYPRLANWTLLACRKSVVVVRTIAKGMTNKSSPLYFASLGPIADMAFRDATSLKDTITQLMEDLPYRTHIFEELEQMTPEEGIEMIKSGFHAKIKEVKSRSKDLGDMMNLVARVSKAAAELGVTDKVLSYLPEGAHGSYYLHKAMSNEYVQKAIGSMTSFWNSWSKENPDSKEPASKDSEEQHMEQVKAELAKQDLEDDQDHLFDDDGDDEPLADSKEPASKDSEEQHMEQVKAELAKQDLEDDQDHLFDDDGDDDEPREEKLPGDGKGCQETGNEHLCEGAKCYRPGDGKEDDAMDHRCEGDLVCAKKGNRGRDFGCEKVYCCTKASPGAGI